MEGAVVEEKAVLTGCVIGRRARIGREAELRDCSVQEGFVVPAKTASKGEIFAGFDEGAAMDDEGDDDDEEEAANGNEDMIDGDDDF